jgi:hypothetical protein
MHACVRVCMCAQTLTHWPQIEEFWKREGFIGYHSVSAKTSEHVDDAMMQLLRYLLNTTSATPQVRLRYYVYERFRAFTGLASCWSGECWSRCCVCSNSQEIRRPRQMHSSWATKNQHLLSQNAVPTKKK